MLNWRPAIPGYFPLSNGTMELFSGRRWRLVSVPLSVKLFCNFINTTAYLCAYTSLHLLLAAALPGWTHSLNPTTAIGRIKAKYHMKHHYRHPNDYNWKQITGWLSAYSYILDGACLFSFSSICLVLFAQFQRNAENGTKLFVLCSPYNSNNITRE